jgi:hypothetical protein
MQNAGVLRQTLIAVADSPGFRVDDLNERLCHENGGAV